MTDECVSCGACCGWVLIRFFNLLPSSCQPLNHSKGQASRVLPHPTQSLEWRLWQVMRCVTACWRIRCFLNMILARAERTPPIDRVGTSDSHVLFRLILFHVLYICRRAWLTVGWKKAMRSRLVCYQWAVGEPMCSDFFAYHDPTGRGVLCVIRTMKTAMGVTIRAVRWDACRDRQFLSGPCMNCTLRCLTLLAYAAR